MVKSEREKVKEWFEEINSKVGSEELRQRKFLNRVEKALGVIDYDYYIATLEPYFDEDGNIFYEEEELLQE